MIVHLGEVLALTLLLGAQSHGRTGLTMIGAFMQFAWV